MIAITGIHGNFYSNPFYYNIGETLNRGGIDFLYAQTNDAFGRIQTVNANTSRPEVIGSWNERFSCTDEDIEAYLRFVRHEGYAHVTLAGHSGPGGAGGGGADAALPLYGLGGLHRQYRLGLAVLRAPQQRPHREGRGLLPS